MGTRRRDFLKLLGLGGAALAVGAKSVLAEPKIKKVSYKDLTLTAPPVPIEYDTTKVEDCIAEMWAKEGLRILEEQMPLPVVHKDLVRSNSGHNFLRESVIELESKEGNKCKIWVADGSLTYRTPTPVIERGHLDCFAAYAGGPTECRLSCYYNAVQGKLEDGHWWHDIVKSSGFKLTHVLSVDDEYEVDIVFNECYYDSLTIDTAGGSFELDFICEGITFGTS
jgi:hypothetical protein